MTAELISSGVPPAWAFYHSAYHVATVRSARVQLVHIAAPGDAFPRRGLGQAGHLAFCGTGAWACKGAPKQIIDPFEPLPEGLRWCSTCLGRAAAHLGRLEQLSRLVVPLAVKAGARP